MTTETVGFMRRWLKVDEVVAALEAHVASHRAQAQAQEAQVADGMQTVDTVPEHQNVAEKTDAIITVDVRA